MSKELIDSIKDRLDAKSVDVTSQSNCLVLDGHERLFWKSSVGRDRKVMMDGEMESLKQIMATNTIRTPEPKLVLHEYDQSGASTIVLEYLNISSLSDISATDLGESLADLHDYNNKTLRFHEKAKSWIGGVPPSARVQRCTNSDEDDSAEDENQFSKHQMRLKTESNVRSTSKAVDNEFASKFIPHEDKSTGGLFRGVEKFGFVVDTACGQVAQINSWTDDWESFFARHRLDQPIRSLLSDHGDRELSYQWSLLQLKIGKYFMDLKESEEKIVPALLHGDLWSGNAAELVEDGQKAVVYDPSSFYGHSEYDLAIVRMFRGFPSSFEKAYFEKLRKKKLFEKRNKLYQLFHHLNHWIHFGSGYRSSSLSIIKELNAVA